MVIYIYMYDAGRESERSALIYINSIIYRRKKSDLIRKQTRSRMSRGSWAILCKGKVFFRGGDNSLVAFEKFVISQPVRTSGLSYD